jgi:hypothetical protein
MRTRLPRPCDSKAWLHLEKRREGEDKPVIGAPGCARSPKKNGFDFVLDRILEVLPVRSEDIRRMGVGGLMVGNTIRSQRGIVPPGQLP